VDDRVSEAAELMSMLEELRPTDPARYNACAELWKRIARVPPAAKTRLLKEVTPGRLVSCVYVCVCACVWEVHRPCVLCS
jgi:hypothetical protein